MSLAITEEHRALTEVARSFLAKHDARAAARAQLEADTESLPPFWSELTGLGWLGLHLPEHLGGEGYGLPELAVVLEALAGAVAPGPFLPTVLAAAVLDAVDGDPELLAALARGQRTAGVGFGGSLRLDGSAVHGDAGPVLGAGLADVLLLPVGPDLAVVTTSAAGVSLRAGSDMDPSRRAARVTLDGAAATVLTGAGAVLVRLARTLAAAEAAGIASACTEMAVAYAKEREQFGRTIGTFQAVKHLCANMLVDAELAIAAAWDAARCDPADAASDLACAVAAARALRAGVRNAQANIQVYGGIGFTWEHDAGIYLRRANAMAALVGALGDAELDVARLTAAGAVRHYSIDLPPEAEQYRAEAAAVAAEVSSLPPDQQRSRLAETGYFAPHWPKPWGRAANAAEQLVIEEEFAGISVASLGITARNILTIIQAGTLEQAQRWVPPALAGQEQWCQLFSEPSAGSDAAAIKTRGVRTEGGWLVTGQKVWTSNARACRWGFATVRTDSSGPKHTGVTMMAIDLSSQGVEVRPLREITGDALFNEVFLDEAFVPDDDVVGEVGQGWAVARAVLGNERVSIGGGSGGIGSLFGIAAPDLLNLVSRYAPGDVGHLREVGALIADQQCQRLLNLRQAARAVQGSGPGPEGNITKLISGEHLQRVTELALKLAGPDAVTSQDGRLTRPYLYGRCLTIAGGTTEIVRNQIAERILKLPRDPLAK
ncbi:MAG: acyl-CoA dehydrogenase [Pseudonocardiales bacterium]|nr:acyl-CoA dehydrogenase [Pseudonocardiales bacterium]